MGQGHNMGVGRRGHPGGRGFCCRWLGQDEGHGSAVSGVGSCGENTVYQGDE